jgi:hypothetical protein
LNRENIIRLLTETLKPLNYIHAFWEGGAAAFNRIDKWSDIDIYLVVDEDKVKETFSAVEEALKSLTQIKQKYNVKQTSWPGVYQAFYRLEKTSEYLIIDLAVLTENAPDKLLEPEIHGKAVFSFNKSGKVKIPSLNKKAFEEKICEKLEKLDARYRMFSNFVQKEINRCNHIEAAYLYYHLTLDMLVDVLRIRYSPLHFDFKTRYIHYELPPKVVERLKQLYFVQDKSDLQRKYLEANEWFTKAIVEIDKDRLLDSRNNR